MPDLIVEVLSPGNTGDDKGKKKKVHEACGVKEYFIIEPVSKSVTPFYHNGRRFEKGKVQKSRITFRMMKRAFKF